MTYRADIDGMRAIAVLAVLFFHAGLGVRGGFVGVDVFFVISGFLITTIVTREVKAGTFTYLGFWERRARRLLPAMTVIVVATCLMGYVVLLPHDFKELGQSVVAQAIAAANFCFWRESGYFAGPSEVKPLLHTWSLAVEEQFYFLMPGMLVLLHRSMTKYTLHALVTMMIASVVWCVYSTPIYPDAAFYLLPARSWELLVGAIVALTVDTIQLKRVMGEALSLVGLCTVAASLFIFRVGTPFPGSYAIFPCLGTAAMIIGNSGHVTLVSRLLAWRPLVFVGLISYSLYLWHWPLFVFANYMTPGDLPMWAAIGLMVFSFLAAFLSWRFVETPFRKTSLLPTRVMVLGSASAALIAIGVIGFGMHYSNGARSRFNAVALRMADGRVDRNRHQRQHHDLSRMELAQPPQLLAGDAGDSPQIIVLGDSHADALMPRIVHLCQKHCVPMIAFTRSNTLPFCFADRVRDTAEKAYYGAILDYLQTSVSLQHVILVARWTKYRADRFNQQNLSATIAGLEKLGLKVSLLRQVPEPTDDVPRFLALDARWQFGLDRVATTRMSHMASQTAMNQLLESINSDSLLTIDLSTPFFATDERALLQTNGSPLYFDGNHLSATGAVFAASAIEATIVACSSKAEQ